MPLTDKQASYFSVWFAINQRDKIDILWDLLNGGQKAALATLVKEANTTLLANAQARVTQENADLESALP